LHGDGYYTGAVKTQSFLRLLRTDSSGLLQARLMFIIKRFEPRRLKGQQMTGKAAEMPPVEGIGKSNTGLLKHCADRLEFAEL